jgi:hypothetical protein
MASSNESPEPVLDTITRITPGPSEVAHQTSGLSAGRNRMERRPDWLCTFLITVDHRLYRPRCTGA